MSEPPLPLLRLPPLDLLRGFVAVGRRMSITQAAVDLCVTQSAISKQVRTLEALLAVSLFERRHRALAFTAEGERLFRSADAALQQLQDTMGALHPAAASRPVTITASIGVTGLWLLPRLSAFQRAQPAIDLRIAAHNDRLDLRAEGIDLAVRYCRQADAPAGARLLFGDTLAPVASPALALPTLASPRDLAGQSLIDYDDPQRPWLQWRAWFESHQGRLPARQRITRYNQYDLVIQAAIAGQGIALGRLALLAEYLRDGRLMRLGQPVDTGYGYWLVSATDAPRQPVHAVTDWLCEQAQVDARALPLC